MKRPAWKTIHVTEECIKNGRRYDSRYCPIALAIHNALPEEREVAVGPITARLGKLEDRPFLRTQLPNIARKFVRDFDIGSRVKPFSFRLNLR